MKKSDYSIRGSQKSQPIQSDVKPTVGFLTTDWAWGTEPLQPNGCAWYRCVLPGVELEKRGWVCGVGIPAFNDRDGFGMVTGHGKAVHGWDIIVFKLIMHKDALDNLSRAQDMGQKIVVDVDDFFDGLEPTNRAYEATDPLKYPDNNREIYAEIIRRSFAVITSTQFLFDYYSKIHNNVFLIRNGIDMNRYQNINRHRRQHHKTKIGWVGATPWRSGDLEILSPFMNNYLVSRNVRFHHSGHVGGGNSLPEKMKLDPRLVTLSNLCPISDYPKLFGPIDIGLVPLNDVPFNHAKSFIKGLEYAAAGIPFIASPAPEYEYLFDMGIGRIARDESDWMYHLDELLNKDLRKDEAELNKEKLTAFSMSTMGNSWDQTMKFILEQEM